MDPSSSGNFQEKNSGADSQQPTESERKDEPESENSLSQTPDGELIQDVEVRDTEGLHSTDKEECSEAPSREHPKLLQECEKQTEEQMHLGVATSISDKRKAEIKKNLDEFSKHTEEFAKTVKNLSVIMAYQAKQRPKQPFMTQPQSQTGGQTGSQPGTHQPPPRLPAPPSYYSPPVPRQPQPQPQPQSQPQPQNQEPAQSAPASRGTRKPGTPIFIDAIPLYTMYSPFFIPGALYSTVVWAPLPPKIPANIPSCLAHLVVTDSFYIIHLNLFDYFSDDDDYFIVQDKNGECLYFVYETVDFTDINFCGSSRATRLHVMDMYQNEVIFMNKLWGSNCCCCCYPEMQVFAPSRIPAGVITKKFRFCHSEYSVLDTDRNRMFKVHGPCCAKCSIEAGYTIRALDENETEVGFIQKEVGFFRSFSSSELYVVTLPSDMDVRVKALILGATFLIAAMN